MAKSGHAAQQTSAKSQYGRRSVMLNMGEKHPSGLTSSSGLAGFDESASRATPECVSRIEDEREWALLSCTQANVVTPRNA